MISFEGKFGDEESFNREGAQESHNDQLQW
jgi:hypothetical protein